MKLHFDVKFLSRQKTKVRVTKFTVLALVFGLTAFTAPISSWAAEVLRSSFKGLVAITFFDGVEGCILTSVGVRASNGTERDGPGKPGTRSEVNVLIQQIDTCQDELLLSAESTPTVSASEFQIDKKLESARLIKIVEVTDSISGNSFDVSLDLTWTAIGPTEVSRSRFYFRSPGRISHEQDRGTFRVASAEGTVSSGATNFLQNATESFANLRSVTAGSIEVIKF